MLLYIFFSNFRVWNVSSAAWTSTSVACSRSLTIAPTGRRSDDPPSSDQQSWAAPPLWFQGQLTFYNTLEAAQCDHWLSFLLVNGIKLIQDDQVPSNITFYQKQVYLCVCCNLVNVISFSLSQSDRMKLCLFDQEIYTIDKKYQS